MLVGFSPAQWAFMHSLNLLFQYWIHTERIDRMPRWFEFVFNTPRTTGSTTAPTRSTSTRNYGGILIVWDRMFGTLWRSGTKSSTG